MTSLDSGLKKIYSYPSCKRIISVYVDASQWELDVNIIFFSHQNICKHVLAWSRTLFFNEWASIIFNKQHVKYYWQLSKCRNVLLIDDSNEFAFLTIRMWILNKKWECIQLLATTMMRSKDHTTIVLTF